MMTVFCQTLYIRGYFSPLVKTIQTVLSTEDMDKLARSTKFVKRSSKLCPVKFLDILIKDASSERGMRLFDYAMSCKQLMEYQ